MAAKMYGGFVAANRYVGQRDSHKTRRWEWLAAGVF